METKTYEPPQDTYWGRATIFRTEVGSTAHGTGLPGVEDYDEMGIFVPPWQEVVGISGSPDKETVVYRPGRAVGEKSGPGDYDLVVHTVQKWARLVARGNPSMLVAVYGPVRFQHPDMPEIPRSAFFSKKAINAFLGYAQAQRQRLEGVRGGKHTNRPELIEQFGFDTKYAMHMVRLGFQGIEYMETGELVFPIPGETGEILRKIRRGEFKVEECLEMAESNEAELKKCFDNDSIPDQPHYGVINGWCRDVFEAFKDLK